MPGRPSRRLLPCGFGAFADPRRLKLCGSGGAEFILSDGSRLPGEIVAGAEDGVECKLNVGAETTFVFEHLAGVRFGDAGDFPRAAALFEELLLDRPAGHDILISRSDEKVRAVPGRIDRLEAQGGSLRVAEQSRAFRLETVFGGGVRQGPVAAGDDDAPYHGAQWLKLPSEPEHVRAVLCGYGAVRVALREL